MRQNVGFLNFNSTIPKRRRLSLILILISVPKRRRFGIRLKKKKKKKPCNVVNGVGTNQFISLFWFLYYIGRN